MQLIEEVKPAAPTPECREVHGSGAIPESLAPPAEADFGAGIAPQPVIADDSSPGNPPESTATDEALPA